MRRTSKLTYKQLLEGEYVGYMQKQVIDALGHLGEATDLDIAKFCNEVDPNRTRPRRNDLMLMGVVRSCGTTSQNGKLVTLWQLVPEPVTFVPLHLVKAKLQKAPVKLSKNAKLYDFEGMFA